MHHYGGGWADIKHTSVDWRPDFAKLRSSNALALGYQEIPDGIPHIDGPLGDELRLNYEKNIGLCAFIFKRSSVITQEWYDTLVKKLNERLPELKQHPATHPQDQRNGILSDGTKSRYPIRWAELLGEIFHLITYRNRAEILQSQIAPKFYAYR